MHVGAAARQDLVEHLGQEQRVDDVAVDLDFLDEAGRLGMWLGHENHWGK